MPEENPDSEFLRLFRELCRTHRTGWRRCQLDWEQLEYILQREALTKAIQSVKELDPVYFSAPNRETADQIRNNAIFAMMTMLQAFKANEKTFLYPE